LHLGSEFFRCIPQTVWTWWKVLRRHDSDFEVQVLRAVDEQKAELRDYKKKAKTQTQNPSEEPVPLTIKDDLSRSPLKA